MNELTTDLLGRFQWVDGHADIWPFFSDGSLFGRMTAAMADPFRDEAITKVAGIEARGFILASAVALQLGAGFTPVRKEGGLFPGPKLIHTTPADYRGNETRLLFQRESLGRSDRVLLADDWIETGSQAATTRTMIEEAGAAFVGATVIVDQRTATARSRFPALSALITAADLSTI